MLRAKILNGEIKNKDSEIQAVSSYILSSGIIDTT
jgi:hypothetical protein